MIPPRITIDAFQGERCVVTVPLDPPPVEDISSWQAVFAAAYRIGDDPPAVSLSTESGGGLEFLDASKSLRITVPAYVTVDLTEGVLECDARRTDEDSEYVIFRGAFRVRAVASAVVEPPEPPPIPTVPAVINVTSSTADGAYGAGITIAVTVQFSEAVVVTGNPTLALNTTPARNAVFATGSGSDTLTFHYVIQGTDNSDDLEYTGTTALSLAAGTIVSADDAEPASLALPTPGAAGSLSANRNIRVDTTAPTVSNVTAQEANGTYGTGQTIHVLVNFPENVYVVGGTPTLALNTTPARNATYAIESSGTTAMRFDYTVQAGDSSADLDYTSTSAITLNGATVRDAAVNSANLTLPDPGAGASLGGNKNIVIDTTAPVVSNVDTTNADGDWTTGQTIAVTVQFSEIVDVTGFPTITLNTTPNRTATYASGTGTLTLTFNYVIQDGDRGGDIDYTSGTALALAGGTIRDVGGTNAALTLPNPGTPGSLGYNATLNVNPFTLAEMTTLALALEVRSGYVFQDAAGTTPATADGDPIGRVNSQLGGGIYASQSTAGNRPTLRIDAQGRWWAADWGSGKSLDLSAPIACTGPMICWMSIYRDNDFTDLIPISGGSVTPASFKMIGASFYLQRDDGGYTAWDPLPIGLRSGRLARLDSGVAASALCTRAWSSGGGAPGEPRTLTIRQVGASTIGPEYSTSSSRIRSVYLTTSVPSDTLIDLMDQYVINNRMGQPTPDRWHGFETAAQPTLTPFRLTTLGRHDFGGSVTHSTADVATTVSAFSPEAPFCNVQATMTIAGNAGTTNAVSVGLYNAAGTRWLVAKYDRKALKVGLEKNTDGTPAWVFSYDLGAPITDGAVLEFHLNGPNASAFVTGDATLAPTAAEELIGCRNITTYFETRNGPVLAGLFYGYSLSSDSASNSQTITGAVRAGLGGGIGMSNNRMVLNIDGTPYPGPDANSVYVTGDLHGWGSDQGSGVQVQNWADSHCCVYSLNLVTGAFALTALIFPTYPNNDYPGVTPPVILSVPGGTAPNYTDANPGGTGLCLRWDADEGEWLVGMLPALDLGTGYVNYHGVSSANLMTGVHTVPITPTPLTTSGDLNAWDADYWKDEEGYYNMACVTVAATKYPRRYRGSTLSSTLSLVATGTGSTAVEGAILFRVGSNSYITYTDRTTYDVTALPPDFPYLSAWSTQTPYGGAAAEPYPAILVLGRQYYLLVNDGVYRQPYVTKGVAIPPGDLIPWTFGGPKLYYLDWKKP